MIQKHEARQLLQHGVDELKLNLADDTITALLSYVELLLKWNGVYSLTAITNWNDIIIYHVLDGLTLVKYLVDNNLKSRAAIIDIGSGMGVPGIIVAICYNDAKVTVLDSNAKKASFLRQVGIELSLNNLTVINSRVEEYNLPGGYDIITSRAFAKIGLFIKLSEHLLAPDGYFLTMKSSGVNEEYAKVCDYFLTVIEVYIPQIPDKRFLVKINK